MSIFTVFLKIRKFISKIRISNVTDYAALMKYSNRWASACYFRTFTSVPKPFINANADVSSKDRVIFISIYIYTLCRRIAKALASLPIYIGLSVHSLLDDAIRT